jgi:hypothetical protein
MRSFGPVATRVPGADAGSHLDTYCRRAYNSRPIQLGSCAMFRLIGRTLGFGCIGAAIVGAVWLFVLWEPEAEPMWRHTLAYDRCLASDRSKAACDAAMRTMTADDEKGRQEYETCLEEAKAKGLGNDPVVKDLCYDPSTRNLLHLDQQP